MAYVKVARVEEIPEDSGLKVEINGDEIALFKYEGKVYAIADTCSHADESLSEGELKGDRVKCPAHGAEFSIITGEALCFPAVAPVQRYKVKVENNEVWVDIQE